MTTKIEPGFCYCGCGGRTKKEVRAVKKTGAKKGDYRKYIYNHHQDTKVKSDQERFQEHIYPDPNSGCFIFAGKSLKRGYGVFHLYDSGEKVRILAHRAAWKFDGRALTDKDCLLHRCDVPECCNPDHLFIGTRRDNAIDRARKGRSPRGKLPYGVQRSSSGRFRVTAKLNGCPMRYFSTYDSIDQAAAVAALVKAVAYGLAGLAEPPVVPLPALTPDDNAWALSLIDRYRDMKSECGEYCP